MTLQNCLCSAVFEYWENGVTLQNCLCSAVFEYWENGVALQNFHYSAAISKIMFLNFFEIFQINYFEFGKMSSIIIILYFTLSQANWIQDDHCMGFDQLIAGKGLYSGTSI